jgi:AraC family transcriptional regulator
MTAEFHARIEDASVEPVRDHVQVLVPGDQGAFHAIYQLADGSLHRAIVRAPQVCVVPANQPYRLSCQRPSDMVAIGIDTRYFNARASEALGRAAEVKECYGTMDPFLRAIGNVLDGALRSRREPGPAYLESLASAMVMHIATHYERTVPPQQACAGLAPYKLQRVLAFIEQRLSDAIQVRELAEAIHMSPFHFARMFKQATGQPPHACITAQRMQKAKSLLANTDISLVEVAAGVGYQTQAHFTGVFHRHVGVTPRTFRLNARAERHAA